MRGAWDCHAHVIGDPARFPLAPGRSYEPPVAMLDEYLAFLDAAGLSQGVLVQPSVYGHDHRCMLDALAEAGGRLLGVAVPAPDASGTELEALHRAGVRGVRCNLLNPGGLDPTVVAGWAPAMRELGWHVELHADVSTIPNLPAFIEGLGVEVVFDHMGRPGAATPSPIASRDPAPPATFSPLLDAVRAGLCWVKLSAPYRLTSAPPPWPNVAPMAREFLDANPARCLWGSDWPHVDTDAEVTREELMGALESWCPETERRRAILVENPGHLYMGLHD